MSTKEINLKINDVFMELASLIMDDNLVSQVANTEKRVEYREKIKKIGSDIKRLVNERDRLLSSVNDNLFKQNMPWILLGTSGYVDR